MRISNTVAAAITNRRVLEPVEAHIALMSGAVLLLCAILAVEFPRGFAYPIAVLSAWAGAALIWRGVALHRSGSRRERQPARTERDR